jgi:hypothetical protein
MIEVSEAAFVLDLVLRFVGLPRIVEAQRLSQASVSCCVTCADLMARGDEPPARTRPLDHVVYEQFRDVITNDPTFAFLSWIEMRKTLNLPAPRLDDPKMLHIWNDFRRTMALPALIDAEKGEGKIVKLG